MDDCKSIELPVLKSIIVDYGDVTIGSAGWTYFKDLEKGFPNKSVVFTVVHNFGQVLPADGFGIATTFIYGAPNLKITKLSVKFFYYD